MSTNKSYIKSTAAALLAAVISLSAAGCSSSSSSSASSSKTASESVTQSSETTTTTDSESSEQALNEQGEHIKKAYEFFSRDNYTIDFVLTDNDGVQTQCKRVKRGDDFYQISGTLGSVSVGGETYAFDTALSAYAKVDSAPADSVVLSVVDDNLPMTNAHTTFDDADNYDVEEYTYTGDTFITVIDFCFDKESGNLVKYISTYSMEGQDNVTETREFSNLSEEVDETLLNTAVATSYTDFAAMTEDVRLSYCQNICNTAGITTDDLTEFGTTTDKLKTISFEDFVNLYYTYGYKK